MVRPCVVTVACQPVTEHHAGASIEEAKERMDVIAAYRDVGTYRGAAAICGTTHKTVRRIIEAHEAASAGRRLPQPPWCVSAPGAIRAPHTWGDSAVGPAQSDEWAASRAGPMASTCEPISACLLEQATRRSPPAAYVWPPGSSRERVVTRTRRGTRPPALGARGQSHGSGAAGVRATVAAAEIRSHPGRYWLRCGIRSRCSS